MHQEAETAAVRDDTAARIVDAAATLLRERGSRAVTTRRVAEAAGVHAPAIYRHFGDRDGLLEAVAEHVMAAFVAGKAASAEAARAEDVDPVADLRAAWDTYLAFGLDHPALFHLLADPERRGRSDAAAAGLHVLRARVRRVAEAGRLRVPERRAVDLIAAAGSGTVQTLLANPPDERDPALADAMLDTVLGRVLTRDADAGPGDVADPDAAAVVALRARAADLAPLSPSERLLLTEWLDRILAGPPSAADRGGGDAGAVDG